MKHSKNRHKRQLAVVLSLGLLMSGFSPPVQNQPAAEDAAVSSSEAASLLNVGALSVEEQRVAALEAAAQAFPVVASVLEQSEGLVEGQDYSGYIVKLKIPAPGEVSAFDADPAPTEAEMVQIDGVKAVVPDWGMYATDNLPELVKNVDNSDIAYIQPNYIKTLCAYNTFPPTDPLVSSDWNVSPIVYGASHLFQPNAKYAYDNEILGEGVKIAIIDSGINKIHEDFVSANIHPGYDVINDDTDPSDDGRNAGHGTFISGLIAAQPNNGKGIAGVAPKATIIPIKVFSDYATQTDTVVAGIYEAIELGADVINLSLGHFIYDDERLNTWLGPHDGDAEYEAITQAKANGIIVIAGSGNDYSSEYFFPASYDNVISVGALKPSNAASGIQPQDYTYTIASYSQHNDRVDCVAVGSDLPSIAPNSVNQYIHQDSGTSYATPVVAGMAALCKEVYPAMTQDEFQKIIETTSTDMGDPGKDNDYGYGAVNFEQAIKEAERLAGISLPFGSISSTAAGTLDVQARQNADSTGYNWETDGTKKKLEIRLASSGTDPLYATICVAEYDSSGKTLMAIPEYMPAIAQGNGYYTFHFTATPNSNVKIFVLNNNLQALAVSEELTVPAA